MTDSNPADGILSLTIKDRAALQAAYMPFIPQWRPVRAERPPLCLGRRGLPAAAAA